MIDPKELSIDFKYIPGYEGLYSINKNGDVYSHYKNIIVKTHTNRKGYLMVNLYKSGVGKLIPIHRLIALTFIPNPENKPEIDHIDTNRKNNSIDNLRWCTRKENCNNPLTLKHAGDSRRGEKNCWYGKKFSIETKQKLSISHRGRIITDETRQKISRANKGRSMPEEQRRHLSIVRTGKYLGIENPSCRPVTQFTKNMEFIKEWGCTKDASRALGICYNNIVMCKTGKRKSAGGFIWK